MTESQTKAKRREPTGMNIKGETMAEYYQRRTRERGIEIERLKGVLAQALDCINWETPEDCTHAEAREDTIQKIRDALNGRYDK